jgi:hypothetical protein
MIPEERDPSSVTVESLTSSPPFFKSLRVCKSLGKGANNRVWKVIADGNPYALRGPRRGSDTQQRYHALWEYRQTLRSSQLGVSPAIYKSCLLRHKSGRWPAGLYVLTDCMDVELDDLMIDHAERATVHRGEIVAQVLSHLKTLAQEHVFVYDLKPSNVMISFRDDRATVKLVDFGTDFCEWGKCRSDDAYRHAPILDMIRATLKKRTEMADRPEDVDHLTSHILFVCMLVQLSSTTTARLHEERRHTCMSAAERTEANPFAPAARALLDSVRGIDLSLVRDVLRTDEVRGVLQHYNGRRNAGTRRTLRFARGYVERDPLRGDDGDAASCPSSPSENRCAPASLRVETSRRPKGRGSSRAGT